MNALLIVDLQNDFCQNGALEVPGANTIVPVVNRLITSFGNIIQTQDWHPAGHHSFASSHDSKAPYGIMEMDYGTQILWPDHCIQGSRGAEFHPELNTRKTQVIIRKGFRREIDSYSAFYENDHETKTGLTGYLKDRGITDLYTVGLAADFCVKWTVLDGIKEGFNLHIVEDAVKGIDLEGSLAAAWDEMKDAGVNITTSDSLIS